MYLPYHTPDILFPDWSSMAPKYTLHYFRIPARGEFIRVIFNHAGVDFEDITFPFSEQPKIKANGKFFLFTSTL